MEKLLEKKRTVEHVHDNDEQRSRGILQLVKPHVVLSLTIPTPMHHHLSIIS
jgi:hypothetical protein